MVLQPLPHVPYEGHIGHTDIVSSLGYNQHPTILTTSSQPSRELAAIKEIPTAQITPPPGTDESIEKKTYEPEGSSKAARKQLFTRVHDQTSEEDIHQAEAAGQENEKRQPHLHKKQLPNLRTNQLPKPARNQSMTSRPQQL